MRKGLNLYDENIMNENFYNLGYHSTYSVINFGNLFIVMVVYKIIFILLGLTSKCKNGKILKVREKFKENVNFASLLSFFSESYLLLAISCFTNFNYWQFKTPG